MAEIITWQELLMGVAAMFSEKESSLETWCVPFLKFQQFPQPFGHLYIILIIPKNLGL